METLKQRLKDLEQGSPKDKCRINTFGWIEHNPTDDEWPAEMPADEKLKKASAKIPQTAHRQIITPLSQLTPQAELPAYIDIKSTFEGQDDIIYMINRKLTRKELPARHVIFPSIWRMAPIQSKEDLLCATYPLRGRTYHYLRHSPQFDQFLGLPDLASSKFVPQYYLSGVGDNVFGESIAHIVDHPLKDVLAYLPQCLALGGALREWNDADAPGVESLEAEAYFKNVDRLGDGTVRPWSYAGTYLSLFALHREDANLPSANLHIAGASKIWIGITEEGMKRLNDLIGEHMKSCFTHHRRLFIHPNFLIRHNIPFNVAFQQPGDLILSDALGAHEGWNAGENCALACNYVDSHSVAFLASHMFDATRPSTGKWPCVCGEDPRPCVTPDTTKKRLSADWFDLKAAYDERGNPHGSVQRSILQWIRLLKDHLDTDPQLLLHSDTPNAEVIPILWRHAHRRYLRDAMIE
jgi:hypothetical protein